MHILHGADEGALSGALGEAISGFVGEMKNFREAMEQSMQLRDERMLVLERKAIARQRSPLEAAAEQDAPHQKAFSAYLRYGDDDGMRGLMVEEKGLTIAGDGGFLAAPTVTQTVQSVLYQGASLRRLANVVAIESSSYEVLVDKGETGAGWATEADMIETAASSIEKLSIPLHELSAMPKASQRLLDDAGFDVEAWLAERVADRFARAEASAFITGDGMSKPKGILSYEVKPAAIAGDTAIGCVEVDNFGAFPTEAPADCLVDLIYSLAAEYRVNASFVMNSKTAATLRKFKDLDGRFLWTDSLGGGTTSQLMGYPVLICEDMPDPGIATYPVAFGDFRTGYTVVERADLRVLRDPFSAKPHVLFYATKRVGGGVTDFRAIRLLKLT